MRAGSAEESGRDEDERRVERAVRGQVRLGHGAAFDGTGEVVDRDGVRTVGTGLHRRGESVAGGERFAGDEIVATGGRDEFFLAADETKNAGDERTRTSGFGGNSACGCLELGDIERALHDVTDRFVTGDDVTARGSDALFEGVEEADHAGFVVDEIMTTRGSDILEVLTDLTEDANDLIGRIHGISPGFELICSYLHARQKPHNRNCEVWAKLNAVLLWCGGAERLWVRG